MNLKKFKIVVIDGAIACGKTCLLDTMTKDLGVGNTAFLPEPVHFWQTFNDGQFDLLADANCGNDPFSFQVVAIASFFCHLDYFTDDYKYIVMERSCFSSFFIFSKLMNKFSKEELDVLEQIYSLYKHPIDVCVRLKSDNAADRIGHRDKTENTTKSIASRCSVAYDAGFNKVAFAEEYPNAIYFEVDTTKYWNPHDIMKTLESIMKDVGCNESRLTVDVMQSCRVPRALCTTQEDMAVIILSQFFLKEELTPKRLAVLRFFKALAKRRAHRDEICEHPNEYRKLLPIEQYY